MESLLEQCITISARIIDGLNGMCVSFVYGMHTITERRELWHELSRLNPSKCALLILGDFKVVFDIDHSLNGAPVNEAEIRDENVCMHKLDLQFLKSMGQFYSWNKGGQGKNRVFS